jgi:hypothetical protein
MRTVQAQDLQPGDVIRLSNSDTDSTVTFVSTPSRGLAGAVTEIEVEGSCYTNYYRATHEFTALDERVAERDLAIAALKILAVDLTSRLECAESRIETLEEALAALR